MKLNNINILRSYFVIFVVIAFMTPIMSCGNKQENKKMQQGMNKEMKGERKMPVNFFKVVKAKNPKIILNQFQNPVMKDVIFGDQYKLVAANSKKAENGKTFLEFLFLSLKEQNATYSVMLTLYDKDNKKIGKIFAELGKDKEVINNGNYLFGSMVLPEKKVSEIKSYTVSIVPTVIPGLKIQGAKSVLNGDELMIGF